LALVEQFAISFAGAEDSAGQIRGAAQRGGDSTNTDSAILFQILGVKEIF